MNTTALSWSILVVTTVVAVLSGFAQWIHNIAILVNTILLLLGILSLHMKKVDPANVAHLPKTLSRICMVIIILFYCGYGFWYPCIAYILAIILLKNQGSCYKPEHDEGEDENYERHYR